MRDYTITSSIDDEVKYLSWVMNCYDSMRHLGVVLPPGLPAAGTPEWNDIANSDTKLRELILGDNNQTERDAATTNLSAELSAVFKTINGYLGRFALAIPNYVLIHVTRYGPGGGYHPYRGHRLAEDCNAITVLDPEVAKRETKPWPYCFAAVVAHEWTHLVVEDPVVKAHCLIDPDEKESLVDYLCSCNELRSAFKDKYPRQRRYVGKLRENWKSLLLWWIPGRSPTWPPDGTF